MSDADAVAADRSRWNERYAARRPSFTPHPLVADALAAELPGGPVLELAGGRSGSALALAGQGRAVTVVDVSDLALAQLRDEAARRGLGSRIDRVCADATATLTGEAHTGRWALVLATRFWDEAAFTAAAAAVAPGGLLGWEALRQDEPLHDQARQAQPPGQGGAGSPHPYRVRHGGLSARLPAGFTVLAEQATDTTTRLLARAPL
ncbi:hypothetical protein FHS23_002411 [Prauserella isguenensis]|uniref:Methyltransferase domain-containing protein n=1 Tax=Prauserella isguenensis TaxID=1470180 RepID=A0A839S0P5_9PSEU|nr:class I SAM-dependent methyltransferase [Prauserella isguenensis]MBB3051388.1 hypothetical protein [Prauserella isguenensis]